MKCTGCTGNCEQGRKACDCDRQFSTDYLLTDIIVGFFILLYVIGLLMEILSA